MKGIVMGISALIVTGAFIAGLFVGHFAGAILEKLDDALVTDFGDDDE